MVLASRIARPRTKSLALYAFIGLANNSLTLADELLYTYDGQVPPYVAGWEEFDACEWICSESISDGHFVLEFSHPPPGDITNYSLLISEPPDTPPPSLWVEWSYQSNHPLGGGFYSCDGHFSIRYRHIFDVIFYYGNAAISFSGNDVITGLPLQEFHLYRFESLDGVNYRFLVDGQVLVAGHDNNTASSSYLQFGSEAGDCSEWIDDLPVVQNRWDFIRYGTIDVGESIVTSDPPAGFLNPNEHASRDRFTVTYDLPNYAYIDDITVSVTCATAPNCPEAPQVIATKRLDNGPPDVLEIVLDRPLPPNARTVFTFTDVDPANPTEPTINTVSYTFQLGDIDADGDWDLRDFASFQNCFASPPCPAFDFVDDGEIIEIDLDEYHEFIEILTGPQP